MSIKIPIRTVYDNANNAIGLSEMQTGEAIGYQHGGIGLTQIGTAGQVLAVNANNNAIEYSDVTTLAGVSSYLQVSNANVNFVTKSTAVSSNNALVSLINDRMQVANVQALVTSSINNVIDAAPGTLDTLNELAAAIGDDANFITTINTSLGTKASNTYVNAQIGASNTNIRTYVSDTYSTLTQLGNTNSYIANKAVTGVSFTSANNTFRVSTGETQYDATIDVSDKATNAELGATNTALRLLISDRMQVANVQSLVSTEIDNVIAAAPDALNTLNELAAALGDDANFSASVTNTLATKASNNYVNILLSNTNSYIADKAVTGVSFTTGNNTLRVTTGETQYDATIDVSDKATWTALISTNTAIRSLVSDRLQVANAAAIYATKAYAASNTYVNAQIGISNNNIRSFTNQTYVTKSTALATNNSIINLINDRMQVANVQSLVSTEVSNLVDSAPASLDTLNELAAALGDDANFSTTILNTLGTKASNTYVNETFVTKSTALSTNNTIVNLIDDRIQVANAISTFAASKATIHSLTSNTTIDSTYHNDIAIVETAQDVVLTFTAASNLNAGEKFTIVPKLTYGSTLTINLDSSDTFINVYIDRDTISSYASVQITTVADTPLNTGFNVYTFNSEDVTQLQIVYLGSNEFLLTTTSSLFDIDAELLDGKDGAYYLDYQNFKNIPPAFTGAWEDITGKPTFFSGSYNDLTNKPSILTSSDLNTSLQSYVTKSTAVTSNNALISLINDRLQVANVQPLIDASVSSLVDSAPAALDTLNELAAALGDDANFSTTMTNSLAAKANTAMLANYATTSTSQTLTNKTISGASNTIKPDEYMVLSVSDETSALETGTGKLTFRAPFAMTLYQIPRASLTTASSSGAVTVDINESGTSILSTKLTIDASEKTSTTAATAAVLSDTSIADDAEITIDIDGAGTGATGLKVILYYRRT